MGNLIYSKEKRKICKIRDLVVLAYAGDGIITEEELYIKVIVDSENINPDYINKVMQDPFAIEDSYPTSHEEKLQYLVQLVHLMMIDNDCPMREIQYCEVISNKLGLHRDTIELCVKMLSIEYPDAKISYFTNINKTRK